MDRVGHNRIYIYAVYDRVFDKNPCQKYRMHTVCIWSWPTLVTKLACILCMAAL